MRRNKSRTYFDLRCCVSAQLLLVLAVSSSATAQEPGRVVLSGGAFWIGASAAGDNRATETRNQRDSADRLTLFEVDSRLKSVPAIGAQVGVNITDRFGIEGGLMYSRPDIRTRVTNDFEGSPIVTLSDSRLEQYFFDVGILFDLVDPVGRRASPFVATSVGYLRQVSDDGNSVSTGRVYQAGGGLKWFLTSSERVGLRFEGRLGVRDGGFRVGDARLHPFFMAVARMFGVF